MFMCVSSLDGALVQYKNIIRYTCCFKDFAKINLEKIGRT